MGAALIVWLPTGVSQTAVSISVSLATAALVFVAARLSMHLRWASAYVVGACVGEVCALSQILPALFLTGRQTTGDDAEFVSWVAPTAVFAVGAVGASIDLFAFSCRRPSAREDGPTVALLAVIIDVASGKTLCRSTPTGECEWPHEIVPRGRTLAAALDGWSRDFVAAMQASLDWDRSEELQHKVEHLARCETDVREAARSPPSSSSASAASNVERRPTIVSADATPPTGPAARVSHRRLTPGFFRDFLAASTRLARAVPWFPVHVDPQQLPGAAIAKPSPTPVSVLGSLGAIYVEPISGGTTVALVRAVDAGIGNSLTQSPDLVWRPPAPDKARWVNDAVDWHRALAMSPPDAPGLYLALVYVQVQAEGVRVAVPAAGPLCLPPVAFMRPMPEASETPALLADHEIAWLSAVCDSRSAAQTTLAELDMPSPIQPTPIDLLSTRAGFDADLTTDVRSQDMRANVDGLIPGTVADASGRRQTADSYQPRSDEMRERRLTFESRLEPGLDDRLLTVVQPRLPGELARAAADLTGRLGAGATTDLRVGNLHPELVRVSDRHWLLCCVVEHMRPTWAPRYDPLALRAVPLPVFRLLGTARFGDMPRPRYIEELLDAHRHHSHLPLAIASRPNPRSAPDTSLHVAVFVSPPGSIPPTPHHRSPHARRRRINGPHARQHIVRRGRESNPAPTVDQPHHATMQARVTAPKPATAQERPGGSPSV